VPDDKRLKRAGLVVEAGMNGVAGRGMIDAQGEQVPGAQRGTDPAEEDPGGVAAASAGRTGSSGRSGSTIHGGHGILGGGHRAAPSAGTAWRAAMTSASLAMRPARVVP